MDLRQRLDLFAGLCEAVHHAHQKGIIHRDLKPGNVLVKLEEGTAIPKIIDFGIARAQQSLEESGGTVTTVIGTPAYMSPEQILGRGDIDTRSDIYSLGALLYNLLVGCTPLSGQNGALPIEIRLDKLRQGRIQAPSKRLVAGRREHEAAARSRSATVAALNGRIRGDLDRICLKALDRERSRRYGTASEFAGDVRRFLDNRPVSATAPGTWYHLSRFVRRHRLGVAAAGAVSLALFAGYFSTAAALLRTRNAEAQSRRSEAEAVVAADRARAAFAVLQNVLASPDPFVSGRDIRVSQLLERFPEELPQARIDAETEARLRHTVGRTYANMGRYDEAIIHLEIALELRECELGESHPETMETALLATHVLAEQGLFEEAGRRSEDLLARTRAHYGENHPFTLEALTYLAGIHLQRRQFDEGRRLAEQGLALSLKLYGEENVQTLMLQDYIGTAAINQRDWVAAERHLTKALAGFRAIHGEENPRTLETLHNFLSLKFAMGQSEAIESMGEQLFRLQEKHRGAENPITLGALGLWGNILLSNGKYERAQTTYRELLERGKRAFGPDHPRMAYCLHYFGRAAYAAGNYAEAAGAIRRALPIEARAFGAESPRLAVSHYNLGLVLTEIEDERERAGPHFAMAERLFREQGERVGLHATLLARARLNRMQGNAPEAERFLAAASGICTGDALMPPPSNMIVEGIPGQTKPEG